MSEEIISQTYAEIKNQIRSAQVVVPCENFNQSLEFLFFFVLKGTLRLSGEPSETYNLEKNGSVVLPANAKYLIDADETTEIIRVKLPAE